MRSAILLVLSVIVVRPVEAMQDLPQRTAAVGTVWHYVKSNLDGSQPEQIAIFVSGPDAIEVYKYHPGRAPAGLVTARLDWSRGTLVELRSAQPLSAAETREVAVFHLDPGTRGGTFALMGREVPVQLTHAPFSVYPFEIILLARPALRADSLDLMLLNLAYAAEAPTIYEPGRVMLRLEAEELRHGDAPDRSPMRPSPGLFLDREELPPDVPRLILSTPWNGRRCLTDDRS